MKSIIAVFVLVTLILAACPAPQAEPIIKPMKYHGPIPKKSFSLRIGFLGGATNEEMWDKLDALVLERSGEVFTDDFSNSIVVEGTYTQKFHPKFALRANATAAFLRSESRGFYIPSIGEPPFPDRIFERHFDVDLFSLAGDAIYYFTDASVQEFQPFVGGGFSVWVPRAVYTDAYRDTYYSGELVDTTIVRPEFKKTDWSVEAGIQGVFGAHYYLSNNFAVTAEARYHIAQSRFSLTIPTEVGDRNANFVVPYTGFIFSIGAMRAF
ncbi:MAG: hypothetical protein HY770_02110 [Chitinivibrionia bacterium]|nr:hypothetical protein [Chitinivibrionia bacterium]